MYQRSHVSRTPCPSPKFVYNYEKVGLRLFLLVILILITLRVLHQYQKIQILTKESSPILHELIFPSDKDCFISSQNWQFNLASCEQYQKGSSLEVIGNLDPTFDSDFGLKKRLIIKEVIVKKDYRLSVQRWLVLAGIYLREFAISLLEGVKSRLEVSAHGFVAGLIFGNDDYLPPSKRHLFEVIGMRHVLVTSGFHLSYLVSLWHNLLKNLMSKRLSGFICLLSILAYILMVGVRPSVLRACIMTSFSLVASSFFSRRMPIKWSLLLTIAIMILINPWYIDSVSFQLSLAATTAIVLITSRKWASKSNDLSSALVEKLIGFENNTAKYSGNKLSKLWGSLVESAKISTAIQLAILPVISFHFGEVNVLGFLANPLLLWLVPSIFSSSIAFLLAFVVSKSLFAVTSVGAPTIIDLLGTYVWTVTELFFFAATVLEEILGNHALISFSFTVWQVVAWYVFWLTFWQILTRFSQVALIFKLHK